MTRSLQNIKSGKSFPFLGKIPAINYIFFVAPGQISIKPNEIIFYSASALMCMHDAHTHTHAVCMKMEKFSPQANKFNDNFTLVDMNERANQIHRPNDRFSHLPSHYFDVAKAIMCTFTKVNHERYHIELNCNKSNNSTLKWISLATLTRKKKKRQGIRTYGMYIWCALNKYVSCSFGYDAHSECAPYNNL